VSLRSSWAAFATGDSPTPRHATDPATTLNPALDGRHIANAAHEERTRHAPADQLASADRLDARATIHERPQSRSTIDGPYVRGRAERIPINACRRTERAATSSGIDECPMIDSHGVVDPVGATRTTSKFGPLRIPPS